MKHSPEYVRQRLLSRSVVDEGSPLVEGCHCRMWVRAARGGYGRLWDGERVRQATHLAWEAFRGEPVPAGMDVLHRCDRPGCIEERHFFAGTQVDNNADRDAKGRNGGWKNAGHSRPSAARGELHPQSKLTLVQVRTIKRRLRRGRYRNDRPAWLAREFGVSESLVRGIGTGRNWSWYGEALK